MTKVYFLEVLCYTKDSNNKITSRFIENCIAIETESGIVVQSDKSNIIEYFSDMDDLKLEFVFNPKDFYKYCNLTYLGEL